MVKPVSTTAEQAELLSIQALTFLAGEPDRLGRFLAITGLGLKDLRTAAREPGFLLGVLDHVLGNERELIAFAADAGIDPSMVAIARTVLAGQPWERDVP